MRLQFAVILSFLLTAAALPARARDQMLLVARDLRNKPLSGVRFTLNQIKSRPTNRNGATELDLPPNQPAGKQIEVQLVASPRRSKEWFLVNPQVNIPNGEASVLLVLMRRSEFRQFAASARDASKSSALHQGDLTAEDRKRALVDTAAIYGLSANQMETAIQSFAMTKNSHDQAIAAYLAGNYALAARGANARFARFHAS